MSSEPAVPPNSTSSEPAARPHVSSARSLRVMAVFRWLLVVLSLAGAVYAWTAYFAPAGSQQGSVLYRCPMHPEVVSSDPGECPICHMALEPVSAPGAPIASAAQPSANPAPAQPSAAPRTEQSGYTCPMHPDVHSPTPGRCPICKMFLVAEKTEPAPEKAPPPKGVSTVTLGFDRAQAIGVRTAKVVEDGASGALRVTATVAAREGQSAEVRARAPGFIERVAVSETGGRVRAGQELVAIYSPEVYQALSDFVLSARWAEGDERAHATVAATRRRLELLGVSAAVLERALAEKEVPRTISLVTPVSGHVVEKNVTLGSYVTPETLLYRVVNLDRVFVVADVPSAELGRVTKGQKARFLPSARADLAVESEVELIYPSVAEAARTVRIRLAVDNRKLALMPGEFGTLELHAPGRAALWVPRDAIVDTGLDRYVFVELAPGQYEPRHVETGASTADRIEVRSGVSAGESVVSGATFLVDSESRLRAALETRSSAPASTKAAGEQAGHP